MRVLVVGQGSIGHRHARLLEEMGCDVAAVSRRTDLDRRVFGDVASGIAVHAPEYVVVADPTERHAATLGEIAAAGHRGRLLVEKPLFDREHDLPGLGFSLAGVGYNLRFHPVMQRLRERLAGERILTVQAYVGQYLPDWRPGTDYRTAYSAKRALGGGALRDLSHELDYLGWLCGPWRDVSAIGGHFGSLEIDSDDAFALLMRMERAPLVGVQVSYLDRRPTRRILVNTDAHTFEADLVGARLVVDGVEESFAPERDITYRSMHRAILAGDAPDLCTLAEGLDTVRLIEAAERAAATRAWISR